MRTQARLTPERPDAADAARALMHGIFVGEIQALEGAGRTCWDFDTGDGPDEAPFALKLDMARQCWDEARHCEISVKLCDWMGTEIGEFSEGTFLYEAACNPDPVLRLTGVNRALEGLAIDVFNTMREFGELAGDPVLEFCEDWMLADEVTHVKMGSDWLRRLTEDDPERRKDALEFQRIVDKLFSLGGFRGDEDDSPVQAGPPLPRAGRLRRRGDRRDRRPRQPGARGGPHPPGGGRRPRLGLSDPVGGRCPAPRPLGDGRLRRRPLPAIASEMAEAAGLPADREVVVELDDSSPLGRYSLDSHGPDPACPWRAAPSSTPSTPVSSPRAGRQRALRSPVLPGRRPSDRRFAEAPDDEPTCPRRRRSPGKSTPPVACPAPATRPSASAGSTTSATGTASATRPTRPSTASGPLTTSPGPTSRPSRPTAVAAALPEPYLGEAAACGRWPRWRSRPSRR